MAQKIVFASGKGGVGKSSAACGTARALAARGLKVLLADFDIGLRSLDIMLGVSDQTVFDWGDAVCERCEPRQAIIETGGIDFLAAPRSFEEEFTAGNLKAFFAGFEPHFDVILFDAPAGIDRGFSLACACADTVCLVTTPDCVCVRSCGVAASVLRREGKKNIRLIINRFEEKPVVKKNLLNIDDCIDAVGARLAGIIPEDESVVTSSVTGKLPGKNTEYFKACDRIARRIMGENLRLFED